MIKKIEPVVFRCCCIAAVGGFLFCIAATIANPFPEERPLALLLSVVGPIAVMVTFYVVRWAFTGRLKPWFPN